MAQPARRASPAEAVPPVDPGAVERAYRFYRAKRRVELERKRERGRARWRFLVVLLVVVALSIYLSLTVWHQVERLFGL